ncbi:N-formylglutamate amidohydrolase [Formosa haliotis]|uniref:N-formylglutamate amidohydrolase n=1 Tax=Formosa haliotis TaxID=1555194 RepID=UPI000A7B003C|nr:N-formylglutamate amidohydrolase [Formosa haliotis]
MMTLYNITKPKVKTVPIIISSPHSGTYFPPEIGSKLHPEYVANPDDTDWFIDTLYSFASDLGITLITANYNRWVVDLNRDPESKPLYNDGRVITGLVPTTNFNGEALYKSETPSEDEINFRIENYYKPYHQKIEELLQDTKKQFGKALLFDAHSIRKKVPGIQDAPFPDLILGDNEQTSASQSIIDSAYKALQSGDYHVEHNHPFKGGQITRSFGRPQEHIHALQLEMAKTNYMNDAETAYDDARAEHMQTLLKHMFQELIKTLS